MDKHGLNRTAQDVGNIVELGHVNFNIADQRLATLFYVTGLGLTRDPIMMTGVGNMWVNAGRSQFHLPTGEGVRAPCTRVGLVVPDLSLLLDSLAGVAGDLEGTAFSFGKTDDGVVLTCPWGNAIVCHAPDRDRFGAVRIAMPYVEFEVGHGAAEGIARFYREIFDAPAECDSDGRGVYACVEASPDQSLMFRETGAENVFCASHHVQITTCDFSGPYNRLLERGLVTEESNAWQYRFEQIVDPASGAPLFRIDHEVRSMRHPLYGRRLINRNAAQTIRRYRPGFDEMAEQLP